jgi:hypothetical protein
LKKPVARIFIGGDWDADGIVATALLVYSQEKLRVYPLDRVAVVEKKPVDPEGLRYIFGELSGVYDLAVFLDLPYTNAVPRVMAMLKKHFGVKRIMYVDHHISTHENREVLENIVDDLIIDRSRSTSRIIYDILVEKNIRVPARLEKFVEVVDYMDVGKRIPSELMKLFELVKLVSKALTIRRDVEIWEKTVEWLASPVPLPSSFENTILEKVKSIVEEHDRRVEAIATDLAVSAIRIGDFRFIDARSKWRYRGASALASKLASILKAPVILWIDTNKEYTLLIIKAPHGRAYRIAEYLVKEGIGAGTAGHPNLAIIKIPRNIGENKLREYIHKAVYYV